LRDYIFAWIFLFFALLSVFQKATVEQTDKPLLMRKIDPFCFSVRSVMHRYLEKNNEVNFDKIFNQMLGE